MSTEQQQPPQHHHHKKETLETNALGERLVRGWDQFKKGQLVSYRAMAVILLLVAAVGVTIYILSEKAKTKSLAWIELESVNSDAGLQEFVASHPDTEAAKVARMHRARYLLGPEGIEKLATARDEAERKKAVENVEAGRDLMAKLADEFQADPTLRTECYLGLAKAEGALVGITREGSLTEFRGSIDKMVEWLDKVAEVAASTPWGAEAKKTAEAMKNPETREQFKRVQERLYAKDNFALPPGSAPKSPLDGFPGLTPGVPGLPGGPIGPGPTPTTSPIPPSVTPPGPTPPAPKPPEPKPGEPKPPEPKPPEPKAATTPTPSPAPTPPAPKPPEPTPAPKPADPKPPTPPKK